MRTLRISHNSEEFGTPESDELIDSIQQDLQCLFQMFACLSPDDEGLDGDDLYRIVRARAAIERALELTNRRGGDRP